MEHFEQSVLAAKLAVMLYLCYAPLTYFIIKNEISLLIYVVLFAMTGLILLIGTYNKDIFNKHKFIILFIAAYMAGLGPFIFYTYTGNEKALFQVDLIIPVIAIFTMFGVSFSLSILIFFSIIVTFIVLIYLIEMEAIDVFMAFYVIVFGFLISAVSGYLIEKSKRKLFLAKLQNDEFKFIIENSNDAISIFEIKGMTYLYANEIALRRNNNRLQDIVGKKVTDVYEYLTNQVIDTIKIKLDTDGVFSDVLRLKDANENFYYVHTMVQYGFYKAQKVAISVSSDVTELKEAELKIREQAVKDPLTHLYNRYKLDEYSILEFNRFQREKHKVTLIICDIDLFKKVNDTYGHLKGDSVLQSIAKTIQNNVRQTDIVARWGGEEFAILLPNTDSNEAEKIAEKFKKIVADTEHEDVGKVTISCGLSELREDDNQTTWFNRVDEALYQAKKSGRDRVIKV